MQWLFPVFLAAGALIALPIALHLLRRKPTETVGFPTLRFLEKFAVRESRRHRLRRIAVLALRCLIVLLMAAAFGRPFFQPPSTGKGRDVIIVIDNSMSLQAGDRWKKLRSWAVNQAGNGEPGDRLGLLLMNPRPIWLKPLSTDWTGTLQQLEQMPAGFASTRYEPALRLAADVLSRAPVAHRELIWLGDHQRLGWLGTNFSKNLPGGVTVQFPQPQPAPEHQASIASAKWETGTNGDTANLVIHSYSSKPDHRTLTVYRGGTPVLTQGIDLPPDIVSTFHLDLPPGDPKISMLRVEMDHDDLAADDMAYAIRNPDEGLPVLLDENPSPEKDGDFLRHALEASQGHLHPSLTLSPLPTGNWPSNAVAVLRNPASFADPSVQQLDSFLAAGGTALIFVNGDAAQADWLRRQKVEITPLDHEDRLRDWAEEHPVVHPFAERTLLPMLDLNFTKGWTLQGDALEPLAAWSDHSAAIAELHLASGHLLICGFEPTRSASVWPLRPSFAPFFYHAIAWLNADSKPEQNWRVGDEIPLPGTGTWRVIDSPISAPPLEMAGSVTPEAPGIYEFQSGAQKHLFAVNLVPEESDLAPWTDGQPWLNMISPESTAKASLAAATVLAAEEAERRSPLWWWLLAIAALALIGEMTLANRTSS